MVVLTSLVAFLLQSSAANGASTDHERVLEGAKKEGRLVLYTGMDTEEANQYAKEFSKKYPFVRPEVFRSSGEKVQPGSWSSIGPMSTTPIFFKPVSSKSIN